MPEAPVTREEQYYDGIANGGAIPSYPITRKEMYLDGIAKGSTDGIPESPVTREEMYLDAIARGGGGGGGASNVVTGTFKGTTTGEKLAITLNYSGSGYPVAVIIFPTGGTYNASEGGFYNLIQRYAVGTYAAVKCVMTPPAYKADSSASAWKDKASIFYVYKNSSSDGSSYSQGGQVEQVFFTSTNASDSSAYKIARLSSATKMSVYIASTSYGFAANIEYTYCVIYSS